MKSQDLIFLGALGLGAYFLFTKEAAATDGLGGYSDQFTTSDGNKLAAPTNANMQPGAGAAMSAPSNEQLVNQLNQQAAAGKLTSQGATLIKQNTTFQDQGGTTYRTGSNQTVSRLADGQVKVLTVNKVPESKSFFAKPIKVVNGKRTRVY